mgnify:CR=1 FL=1
MNPEDLRTLTVEDAADVLGVSAETVRRYVRRGDLAAMRWGRRIRITPEAIRAFQDARKVRPQRKGFDVREALRRMRGG